MKSGNARVAIITRYVAILRAHGSVSEQARQFRAQYEDDLDLPGRFRQLDALVESAGFQHAAALCSSTKRKR